MGKQKQNTEKNFSRSSHRPSPAVRSTNYGLVRVDDSLEIDDLNVEEVSDKVSKNSNTSPNGVKVKRRVWPVVVISVCLAMVVAVGIAGVLLFLPDTFTVAFSFEGQTKQVKVKDGRAVKQSGIPVPEFESSGEYYYVWYIEGSNQKFDFSQIIEENVSLVAVKTVDIPANTALLVYDGSAKLPVFTQNSNYTISGVESKINAGTYSATVSLKESDFQWADGTKGAKSISWTIAKAARANTVSMTGWTYNGAEAFPTVDRVEEGDTITVTYEYSTSQYGPFTTVVPSTVGTYFVRAIVPESDNFAQYYTQPVKYTIASAGKLAIPVPQNVVYNGLPQGPTIATSGDSEFYTVTITEVNNASGSNKKMTDVGTYWAIFALKDINSYAWDDGSENGTHEPIIREWQVTPAKLTVAADDKAKTYGETNPNLTYLISGFMPGDNAANAIVNSENFSVNTSAGNTSNVGNYDINISAGGALAKNYTFDFVPGTLTVNKTILTVVANDKSKVYGDLIPDLDYYIEGFIAGDDESKSVVNEFEIDTDAVKNSAVGKYDIEISKGTAISQNYDFAFVKGVLTVEKATLTVTANDKSRQYGDASPVLDYYIEGFVTGDTANNSITNSFAVTTTADLESNVGDYLITVSSGAAISENYRFNFVPATLSIYKKQISNPVAAGLTNFEYSGTPQSVGVLGFDAATMNITGNVATNVGSYNAVVTLKNSNNYVWVSNEYEAVSIPWGITKADLTVTVNDKSKVYGMPNPNFDVVFEGFKGADNESSVNGYFNFYTDAVLNSDVGAYDIVLQTGTATSGNYNLVLVNGVLTITHGNAIVRPALVTSSYIYSGMEISAAISNFNESLMEMTVDSRASAKNVGEYTVRISLVNTTSYQWEGGSIEPVVLTWHITPATLTIIADDIVREYGLENPDLTYTVSGLKGIDNESSITGEFSTSTLATVNSAVAPYVIDISQGTAAADNYVFAFINGTLTVTPAVLTVSAEAKVKIYGAANPGLTYTVNGFRVGDTADIINGAFLISTTAVQGSPVVAGGYPIMISVGSAQATNYEFDFVDSILTVNKVIVAIPTIDEVTFEYSGAAQGPTLMRDATSTVLVAGSREEAKDAGEYYIELRLPNLVNYQWNGGGADNVVLEWKITKAQLTITANDKSRAYGVVNPSLDYTISGFKLTDTESNSITNSFTINTVADTASNVGSYPIVIAKGLATSVNYDFAFVNGTLTVVKAVPIFGQARAYTYTYGQAFSALVDTLALESANVAGVFAFENGANVPVVGTTVTRVVFTPADTLNYESKTFEINITVQKANPVMNPQVGDFDYVYGQVLDTNAALLLGERANIAGVFEFANGNLVPQVGTTSATVVFTPSDLDNYNVVTFEIDIAVEKAQGVGSVSIDGWVYGDVADYPVPVSATNGVGNVTYLYESVDGGGEFGETYSSDAKPVNAGTYRVVATFAATQNYEQVTAVAQFTIAKAILTIRANSGQSKTYGDADPMFTYVASGWRLTDKSSLLSGALSRDMGEDVGTYPIDAGNISAGVNYDINLVSADFEIVRAQGLGSVGINGWTYGQSVNTPVITTTSNPSYTVTYLGVGETEYAESGDVPQDAGTYTVKVVFADSLNYVGFTRTADFTIAKAMRSNVLSMADWTYDTTASNPTVGTLAEGAAVTYYYDTTAAGLFTSQVKPINAGTYYVKAYINETKNFNSVALGPVEFKITRAQIAKPVVTSGEFTYDGYQKSPMITTSDFYTIGDNKQTSAGVYFATVILVNANYEWAGANEGEEREVLRLEWEIKKVNLEIPVVTSAPFVYNGKTRTPSVAPYSPYFTISGNEQINTGEYTAVVAITDKANYQWVGGSVADLPLGWSIIKASIEKPTVTSLNFAYDGTPKNPTIATNPAYTISGNLATNANEYTAVVRLDDKVNYKWYNANTETDDTADIELDWAIDKAVRTNVVTLAGWTYGDTANNPSVGNVPDNAAVSYSYFEDAGCTIELAGKPSVAGTYYIRAQIQEGANYFTHTTDAVRFVIAKAGAIASPSNPANLTYNGTPQTPVIAKNENYTIQYFEDEDCTIEIQSAVDAGTYFALVSLDDPTNFEWDDGEIYDIVLEWVIAKATRDNTVSMEDWFVDAAIGDIPSPQISTVPDGAAVTYYYDTNLMGSFTSTTRPSAAGNYYVLARVGAGANYKEHYTDPVQFKIKTPSYSIIFDSNGGSTVLTITEPYLSPITQPTNPTKTGYTFNGWYSDEELLTAVNWSPNYTLVGNVTMYADWRINVLSIVYDYVGGVGAPASLSVDYGDTLTLPVPTRKGFTFDGWTGGDLANASGTMTAQQVIATLSAADKNVTLVAQWVANTLTIIYENNGGIGSMANSGPTAYDFVGGITVKTNVFTHADAYLTFHRWNTLADDKGFVANSAMTMSELWDLAQETDIYGNKTLTLYAIWDTIFVISGDVGLAQIDGVKVGAVVPANLVIPTSVFSRTEGEKTFTITSIGTYAFQNKAAITSVIVPAEITNIGFGAFAGCANLASVTLQYVGQNATQNQYLGYIFGAGNYVSQNSAVPASLKTVNIHVAEIPDYAFYGLQNVKVVNMYVGLTRIGDYAFAGCVAMDSVTIPSTVNILGEGAFRGCTSLGAIDLSATGITEIAASTFENCQSLVSVLLNNTTTLIDDFAFAGCTLLNGILIPNSVQNLGAYAFMDCESLTSIVLTNTAIDTISVGTFSGCGVLGSVALPSGLVEIQDYAFEGTTLLKNLTIPNSVVAFGEAIFNESGLNSITLPFTDANYREIFKGLSTDLAVNFVYVNETVLSANAFANFNGTVGSNLPRLVNINLPANLASIGSGAFRGCVGLTTIDIPNSVAAIGDFAFAGCTALQNIVIPNGATTFGVNLFETSGINTVTIPARNGTNYRLMFDGFNAGQTLALTLVATGETVLPDDAFLGFNGTNGKPRLISITLPTDLTSIGANAFQNCSALGTVSIPGTVSTLGAYCFSGCSALTGIDLASTGVTQIPNGAFKDCTTLSSSMITLKNTTTSIGDSAFQGCVGITGSFTLVDSVTSVGALAFAGLTNMTEINFSANLVSVAGDALLGSNNISKIKIPLLDMAGLGIMYSQLFYGLGASAFEVVFTNGNSTKLINSAFENFNGTNYKPKLTAITLPASITEIGGRAFAGCTALGAITVPNNVETIKASAFEGCSAIQVIDLSNTKVTVIADATFKNCSALNTVTIREDITAIGASAFEMCASLERFILSESETTALPSTVDEIGVRAFYGCAALGSIDLLTTGVRVIAQSAFENCASLASVVLPSGLEEISDSAFKNCASLLSIVVPNNSVTFGSAIFAGSGLTKITLPLTAITYQDLFNGLGTNLEVVFTYNALNTGVVSENAFQNFNGAGGLPALTRITIPTGVTVISANAFNGCNKLTYVNMSDTVTGLGNLAFAGCATLGDIRLSNVLETMGNQVFTGCTNLRTIVVPNSVTAMGNNLFESSGIHTVTMPLRNVNYQLILSGFATNSPLNLTLTATAVDAIPVGAFMDFNGTAGLPKLVNIITPNNIVIIGNNAFKNCVGLTGVNLYTGLETIGISAFENCTSLQGVAVPSSVSVIDDAAFRGCILLGTMDLSALALLETISDSTFKNCVLLATVLLPTSIENIEASAFYGCAVLNGVDVPSNVNFIGEFAFYGCHALTEIDLSCSGATGISTISVSAFEDCVSLARITLPANITEIQNRAFAGTVLLTSVVIPNTATTFGAAVFTGGGLTNITLPFTDADYTSMFSGLLTNLTVNFVYVNEVIMSAGAFENFDGNGLPKLVSISLPANLESIGASAFGGCNGLTVISIPNTVTLIGNQAFQNCTKLQTVTFVGASVLDQLGNKVFSGCSALQSITIPTSTTTFGINLFEQSGVHTVTMPLRSNANFSAIFAGFANGRTLTLTLTDTGDSADKVLPDGAFLNFDGSTGTKPKLINIYLPNINEIGYRAFEGCTGLTLITIPDSVNLIGERAFESCTFLREIDLSGTSITQVKDSTFKNCIALEKVLLGDDIVSIGNNAFYSCAALNKIDIPSNVDFLGNYAFYGCANLKKIDLSVVGASGLSTISVSAFENCVLLDEVILPSNTINIQDRAFAGCIALKNIVIPNNEVTFGANIFSGAALAEITMPFTDATYNEVFAGLTTDLEIIFINKTAVAMSAGAFANFNGTAQTQLPRLVKITLPTNLTSIGSSAFMNCVGLKSFSLAATGVTRIEDSTFMGCVGLQNMVFRDGITHIGVSAFNGCVDLTNIILPNSVTTISATAFANCSKLTSIDFGTGLTSLAESALTGSTLVTSAKLPLQNISYANLFNGTGGASNQLSVTFTNNMASTPITKLPNNAFSGFNGTLGKPRLVSVLLPTELTEIGENAFFNCAYLPSIIVYENVSVIGAAAFAGCAVLGGIDLSQTAVTVINGDTFMNCTQLSTVALSDDVIYIGNRAFYSCKNLGAITVPSNVDFIGSFAFYQCEKLVSIDLSRENAIGLAVISQSAFEGCKLLSNITLPSNTTHIEDRAFAGCAALNTLVVPDTMTTFGSQVFSTSGLQHITMPFTNAVYSSVFTGITNNLTIVFHDIAGNDELSENAFKDFNGTALSNLPKLVDITLPENLLVVGVSAFSGCVGLTIVTIPNSVAVIDNLAFAGCTALYNVTLSNTLQELGDKVFSGCNAAAFTSIVIPSSVEIMGVNLFESSGITTVSMPLRNGANYQSIFHGFANGRTLTLTLTATGETVLPDGAFANFIGTAGKPRLTSININTSGITHIGVSAFAGCTGVGTISLPATLTTLGDNCFNGSGLTAINLGSVTAIPQGAFKNCVSLGLVTFNPSTLSIGASAFEGCGLVHTGTASILTLPNSVATVGAKAFGSCVGLTQINFGTGLTGIANDAISGAVNLEKVALPLLSTVTSYETLFYGIGGTTKNFEVVFTNGDTTTLVNSAFSGFNGTLNKPKLTAITLPANLTALGSSAFENCSALGAVAIPSGVATMGNYCFRGCLALTAMDLSGTQVTDIPQGAFMSCTALKTVTLKSTAGTTATIGASAFENSGLENIYNINNGTLTTIGASAFYNSKLKSLDLSNTVITAINNSTFANCAGLSFVTLPYTLQTIGEKAFYQCVNLGASVASGSVNTATLINMLPDNVLSIGVSAFEGCVSMENMNMTGTQILDLADRSFMNCYELTRVDLPTGLKTIGVSAFENDAKLVFVTPTASLEYIYSQAFKGCSSLSTLTMYNILSISPDALLDCEDLSNITMRYISGLDYHALFYREGEDLGDLNLTFTNSDTDKVLDDDIFKGFNGTNGLPRLKSITLPTNLTHIGDRAFENCHYLDSPVIPSTVVSIGIAAFRNCLNIENIILTTTGVTEISDDTFSGCIRLSDVYFNVGTTKIGERAFLDCTALTDISSAGMTSSLTTIGKGAFQRSGLTYLDLRVTGVTQVAEDAFREAKLTTVYLNTSTTQIGVHAFSSNVGLDTINISSLTSLGVINDYAFYGCTAMSELVCPSSLRTIGNFAFCNTSLGAGGATVSLNSGLTGIGNNAFASTSLTAIVLPISLVSIGESIFAGCTMMTSAVIPLGNFNYQAAFTGITQNIAITVSQTSVTALPANAFQNFNAGATNKPRITSITLPNNLTSIGASAFQNCGGITSITIPAGVGTIGNYAFASTGLAAIDLTGTNVTAIGSYVFQGCTALNNVQLKNTTTGIGAYAFDGCTGLGTIDIPNSVASIGSGAFRNTALASINLGNTGVTVINDRVFQNTRIASITLNTATTSIGAYAFAGDTALGVLDLSGVTSLSSIGDYAFSGCASLATVTLNNGLGKIGSNAFQNTAIKSITIPNTVRTLGANIFTGCSLLTNISMPLVDSTDFNYSAALSGFTNNINLTLMFVVDTTLPSGSFAEFNGTNGKPRLSSIILPNGLTTIGDNAFQNTGGYTTMIIPDTVSVIGESAFAGSGLQTINLANTAVTVIAAHTFEDNSALNTVTLPSGLVTIGESAFEDCVLLGTMIIPNTVKTISARAFANCVSYTSVNLSEGLLTIDANAFENTKATSLIIPTTVTTLGADLFSGTTTLGAITLPHRSGFSYTQILNGFTTNLVVVFDGGTTNVALPTGAFSGFNGQSGKPRLVSVTLPNALTGISDNAFNGCTGLTSVGIPNTVTAIGNYAFNGCSGLTSVDLPAGLLTIGNYAFSGCGGLMGTVTLPDGITDIGNSAFANCTGITTMTLPESLTSVGTNAFSGCTNLTTLEVLRSYVANGNITTGNGNGINTSATIFVWNDSLAQYKSSWYSHAGRIRPFDPVITFNSNSGSTVGAIETYYGYVLTLMDKPVDPVRMGYTFGGWYLDNTTFANAVNWTTYTVTDNVTFYAKWTINQYTITFDSNGGSAVSAITRNYGTSVAKPTNPTKTGHTFDGWYTDNGTFNNAVTWSYVMTDSNVTFYAKWTVNVYTITLDWRNNGASSTTTRIYEKYADGYYSDAGANTLITSISAMLPTRTGYSFQGYYSATTGGTQYITNSGAFTAAFTANTFTANTTLYAQWQADEYEITWVDGNGATIYTEQIQYGVTPVYNSGLYGTPTKTATPQYTYTFSGWSPTINLVTGTQTYTATFTQKVRSYVVTWMNGNGDVIYTESLNYGATPSYNLVTYGAPQKDMNAQYSYIFNSWSPVINTVTGAQTYIATFTQSIRAYTVAWLDGNGVTIYSESLNYGVTPSYDQTTYGIPQKDINAEYIYTFNGTWSPVINTVTGAATYRAQFGQTTRQYTITFQSNGGSTISPITADYGTSISQPVTPTKAGHAFDGWYTDNETFVNAVQWNLALVENLTVYAKWIANTVTISYNANGGGGETMANTVLQYTDTVMISANAYEPPYYEEIDEGGEEPVEPEEPTEPETVKVFVFIGWNTHADGQGIFVDDSTTMSELWNLAIGADNKTLTLYATWELTEI